MTSALLNLAAAVILFFALGFAMRREYLRGVRDGYLKARASTIAKLRAALKREPKE